MLNLLYRLNFEHGSEIYLELLGALVSRLLWKGPINLLRHEEFEILR